MRTGVHEYMSSRGELLLKQVALVACNGSPKVVDGTVELALFKYVIRIHGVHQSRLGHQFARIWMSECAFDVVNAVAGYEKRLAVVVEVVVVDGRRMSMVVFGSFVLFLLELKRLVVISELGFIMNACYWSENLVPFGLK